MAKHKHIPRRTCVVCRGVYGKRELTRLVRTSEGRVEVDPSGKVAGRGAYICHQPACWQQALSTSVLNKALRVTLSDDDHEELTKYAEQYEV